MNDSQLENIVRSVIKELQNRSDAPAAGPVTPSGGSGVSRRASNLTIAVLGAGNGGLAMAGHLALLGNRVRLFSFFERELAPVADGTIEILGQEVTGRARVEVFKSLDAAVKDANLVMIVSPAYTHVLYASLLAGLLEKEQVVVLNPGRTGGALEFGEVLRRYALRHRIYLAETQTFIYAAETRAPGKVEILKEKFKMRVAALPATDNPYVIPILQQVYPQIEAAQHVLETSMNNVGPVNHVAPMLLNTSVIERVARGEDLHFYRDMINPTVCNLVMEKVDAEKCSLARALGNDVVWTTLDWYRESYHVNASTLYEAYTITPYIQGFSGPRHILAMNNVLDEIPSSLVPWSCFGKALGVPTPTIDALVDLAGVMCGIDFRKSGRTLDKLGLEGMSAAQMVERVERQPLLGDCATTGVCQVLPQFS